MKLTAAVLVNGLLIFISQSIFSQQTIAPLRWTPELQMKVNTPGTPRISPDGKKIVYTITSAVMSKDKSENNTQIWMSTTEGKEKVQLTSGDKSSANPKWSPDGNSIAFSSNRNNNRNNIFLIAVNGGQAKAITDLKGSVGNFEFSPDGKSIAFIMSDTKTEEEEKNDKGKNDYRWVDENVKQNRLYLIYTDTGRTGMQEPVKLTSENYNVTTFDWAPDGKSIVFAHTERPGQNFTSTTDISLLDLKSAKTKLLTGTSLPELLPSFSPDGKYVIFIGGKWPKLTITNEYNIKLIPVTGGSLKTFPFSLDGRSSLFPGFASDGKYYFTEARGTITQLFALDISTGKLETFHSSGVYTAISLNQNGTMFGFIGQTSNTPPEIFVSQVSKFEPINISNVNEGFPNLPIGKTEVIRWKSSDGKEIEGLLTYPVNYKTGQRVPMILNIHGGPNGIFQQTFLGNPDEYPLASFASSGFAILRVNPRGSIGYGTAFRRAVIKDFGGMDYQDLMTGVDKVIQMGIADSQKLGVMGWSYGGFMTTWIITHTKRFKAASAGAAPTNFLSMVGQTDYPNMVTQYLGNDFWEDPKIYQKLSPINYIKGVTTPTLIQHGESDVRVPVSQGYEFFYALKAQKVPVRMMILPRQPHVTTEPKMVLAAMQANLEWFTKYLGHGEETVMEK